MKHLTCTDCHTKIPTGLAVIRTRSFQRVAFHQGCYADLQAELHPEAVEVAAQQVA